jgi:hypothetical protein
MYVTPYLFKRHCSDVPSFRVGGKESPLFMEYYAHFLQTWRDQYTVPIIPTSFIKLLVEKPETLDRFLTRRHAIQQRLEQEWQSKPELSELPEFYVASETAMYEIVGEQSRYARSTVHGATEVNAP